MRLASALRPTPSHRIAIAFRAGFGAIPAIANLRTMLSAWRAHLERTPIAGSIRVIMHAVIEDTGRSCGCPSCIIPLSRAAS